MPMVPIPTWMTIEGDITSSVDWNAHSHPADLAVISISAPNQVMHINTSPADFPFYLDSGATTTHILPS